MILVEQYKDCERKKIELSNQFAEVWENKSKK